MSPVATRLEKPPVELRRRVSARNASLRLSAASLCTRPIAMLAMCVNWSIRARCCGVGDLGSS